MHSHSASGTESCIAAAAKSLQSCPTLCNPMDSSPPGSSVMGFSKQEYWSGLPCPSPQKIVLNDIYYHIRDFQNALQGLF